jgi:glycosyltransferase involved in cell wall biosynthesis
MAVMQWWFGIYLRVAEVLGYAIVWTAHDLLPHEPVFIDDARARDLLLAKARVVIALSDATAQELRQLGARDVRVIPIGPYASPYAVTLTDEEARASFGYTDRDIVVSLIGRIEPYKGADLLLRAVGQLPSSSRIKVLLAGSCSDDRYRDELVRLSDEAHARVVTRFQWVPDHDLARYLQATDVAVFPFREITNSASVLLAQSFAKPVVISDLPSLRDIPEASAIRCDADVESLGAALEKVERLSPEERRSMGAAGLAWANRADWDEVARETIATYAAADPS